MTWRDPDQVCLTSAWQCGRDRVGIGAVASGSRVKSLWIRAIRAGRGAGELAMNESVGVSNGGDNAVSRKLFGHVNVVDVGIGGLRRGDSSLDYTIETSCRFVNSCPGSSAGRLKQEGYQSTTFVPHAPHHTGIQVCEML